MAQQGAHCLDAGYLVGAENTVPDDTAVFHSDASRTIVGCNRIVCSQCSAPLHQWAGVRLAQERPRTPAEYRELYDTTDTTTSRFLTQQWSAHLFRVYACLCWNDEISAPTDLNITFLNHDGWSCAGHP